MYQIEPSRGDTSLVALQVPDQVPANPAQLPQRVLFLYRFLDAVLTDVGDAGGYRGANRVRPKSLGHGDDRDPPPPGVRGTSRELCPHLRQTLREGLKTHSRSI